MPIRSDTVSEQRRSEIMRAVKSQGNKDTELALARFFRQHQIAGWRRAYSLCGKPDFVFPKLRVVIFVDGCFWHGCPRCYRRPASNTKYWDSKVSKNRQRDRKVRVTLRRCGWRVLRIWEHELARKNQSRLLRRLQVALL